MAVAAARQNACRAAQQFGTVHEPAESAVRLPRIFRSRSHGPPWAEAHG